MSESMMPVAESHTLFTAEPSQRVDRIVPVVRGGPDHAGNLVAACRACNLLKGAAVRR